MWYEHAQTHLALMVDAPLGTQAGKTVHASAEQLDRGGGGRFLRLGRNMKEQRKYTTCCALQGEPADVPTVPPVES